VEGIETHRPSAYESQMRLLLGAAMVIFVFTVVVGILNGTDIIEFDRKTILTHVHTGTLGWITTAVFAAALWLFDTGGMSGWRDSLARKLPVAFVVAAVAYNIAFLLTYGRARPTIGGLALLVIVGWVVWIFGSAKGTVLSVPRLGILAAVATLLLGSLLGVLLGEMLASGNTILPGDAYGSHPATMVVGFLVPVGMALAEWQLRPESLDQRATGLGWAQIGLPFIGGLCVTAGLLGSSTPLVALSLPFEIIGVGIFVYRLRSVFGSVRLGEGTARALALPAVPWLVVNIALFVYLIGRFQGDVGAAPPGLIIAIDHIMFVGVLSSTLFAQVHHWVFGPSSHPAVRVLFWALNVGLLGFAVGLLFEIDILKQIFTPIMGLGILHGVAFFLTRLWTSGPGPVAGAAAPRESRAA
jgi:hypothetical protein